MFGSPCIPSTVQLRAVSAAVSGCRPAARCLLFSQLRQADGFPRALGLNVSRLPDLAQSIPYET